MRHMKHNQFLHSVLISGIVAFFIGCSASNCPLESTVLCNYGFYDSEGTPVSYNDPITVTTLLPGFKTVYIYKKLGYLPVTLTHQDLSYVEEGYTETISEVRKDTVLINSLSGASTMSVPMNYFSDTDTIILSYSSITNKDTIYISHKNYTHIDLPECGTNRFHTLTSIRSTESAIYSVKIANKSVNYDGEENVKIYFNGTAE